MIMLKVGLTGGIGSGKTTVAELFQQLGAPIIDADLIAREITEVDQPAYLEIVKKLGDSILLSDRQLDRKKLRDRIFADDDLKQWLEELLHPVIKKAIIDRAAKLTFAYCIVSIPLLVETHSFDLVDRVLVIETNIDLQIERTIARDTSTPEQILKIIHSQATGSQRVKFADDIIYNNGDLQQLAEQVQKIHIKYLALSKS